VSDFKTLGEITIPGRPDFDDHEFGKTYAKKFPQYVYSPKGYLIHKVASVMLRWWDGNYDHMVRLRNPVIIAETVCGMSKFIKQSGRIKGQFCAIPKPDAVLCKKCFGEASATFPRRDATSKERARLAKVKLGCIALTEGKQ
jgi:hypothetical protein